MSVYQTARTIASRRQVLWKDVDIQMLASPPVVLRPAPKNVEPRRPYEDDKDEEDGDEEEGSTAGATSGQGSGSTSGEGAKQGGSSAATSLPRRPRYSGLCEVRGNNDYVLLPGVVETMKRRVQGRQRKQLVAWRAVLEYELGNPMGLAQDEFISSIARVYELALCCLRHVPEIW